MKSIARAQHRDNLYGMAVNTIVIAVETVSWLGGHLTWCALVDAFAVAFMAYMTWRTFGSWRFLKEYERNAHAFNQCMGRSMYTDLHPSEQLMVIQGMRYERETTEAMQSRPRAKGKGKEKV